MKGWSFAPLEDSSLQIIYFLSTSSFDGPIVFFITAQFCGESISKTFFDLSLMNLLNCCSMDSRAYHGIYTIHMLKVSVPIPCHQSHFYSFSFSFSFILFIHLYIQHVRFLAHLNSVNKKYFFFFFFKYHRHFWTI